MSSILFFGVIHHKVLLYFFDFLLNLIFFGRCWRVWVVLHRQALMIEDSAHPDKRRFIWHKSWGSYDV